MKRLTLVGAVANTVAEVRLRAVARHVAGRASELGASDLDHVVDACLLGNVLALRAHVPSVAAQEINLRVRGAMWRVASCRIASFASSMSSISREGEVTYTALGKGAQVLSGDERGANGDESE